MVDTQPPTHTYAHKLAHAPIKTKRVHNTPEQQIQKLQKGRQVDRQTDR